METLHQLAGRIINSFLPAAVQNNNFFINDIPNDLKVDHNQEWVESVIGGVITSVVDHARSTCIRVSAKIYGYVMVLEVHEAGSINGYAMACSLQQAQTMAQKIGGCLSISIQQPTVTTIAFSFPNLPIAA